MLAFQRTHVPFRFSTGFEAPLKHMADAGMGAVEALGIDTVQLAHAFGEVGIGRFDEQVIMIGHLAISVTDPVEAPADFGKRFEPGEAIVVGQKNILAPIAARGDVIKRAGEFES